MAGFTFLEEISIATMIYHVSTFVNSFVKLQFLRNVKKKFKLRNVETNEKPPRFNYLRVIARVQSRTTRLIDWTNKICTHFRFRKRLP
jgi:hypothetical protein